MVAEENAEEQEEGVVLLFCSCFALVFPIAYLSSVHSMVASDNIRLARAFASQVDLGSTPAMSP